MGNSSSSGGARQEIANLRSQLAQIDAQRKRDAEMAEKRRKEDQERAAKELKRTEELYKEQQRVEREKNEMQIKIATMKSKEEILKTKQQSLVAVKQELSKANQDCDKQQTLVNSIFAEISSQSKNISRKWLQNAEFEEDSKEGMPDCDAQDRMLDEIDLLQKKLSNMRVLIAIGKTGCGKSTFLNRMIGDTSDNGDEGNCYGMKFKVGHNLQSETSDVAHTFIKEHSVDGRYYCVVDTPGSCDSYGRDNIHTNNIAEYLRGCGGVNAFLIFVNLMDARIDYEYIKLLKLYKTMLGDRSGDWWKHVIVIGTNYDVFLLRERNKLKRMNETDREDYLQAKGNEFLQEFRNKKELGIPHGLPMKLVPIGHDNYEDAIENALSQVQGYKFNCDKIVSPLNQLKLEAMKEEETLNTIKLEVNKIQIRKERIEEEIEFICNEINTISKTLQQGTNTATPA